MKTQTKTQVKKVAKTGNNARVENLIVSTSKKETIKKTKEEIANKRKLNPQFSHVVSKQKKIDLLEFKSNGLKVLLSTKTIVKNIQIEGYTLAENFNTIEKCIGFINFVTKTNKANDFVNNELLQNLLSNTRTTKSGLYTEYYFSQLVQKIVTLSIKKGFDYQTALNIIVAKKNK